MEEEKREPSLLELIAPRGFSSVPLGFPDPSYSRSAGDVVAVQWNYHSECYSGMLTVDYDLSDPSKPDLPPTVFRIKIKSPCSFRVQDEADMCEYWEAVIQENVTVSNFYQIEDSSYLRDWRCMSPFRSKNTKHLLITGANQCVEFISDCQTSVGVELIGA